MAVPAGFTINKAIGGGLGGLVFGTFGPVILGFLHVIQPVAGAVNPALGALVGVLTFVVTYLTPKNAAPKAKPSS
jgi:hypothetical protein